MMQDDHLWVECQRLFTQHHELDPVLRFLRDNGYNKMDSVKVVMRLLHKPLGEAHALVHVSSVWADTREHDAELYDQFLRALRSTHEPMILQMVRLQNWHTPTGFTAHYNAQGAIPPPAILHIVQFTNDPGFYLIYLDSSGQELTDTYHETREEALLQAQQEFLVEPDEWEIVISSSEM